MQNELRTSNALQMLLTNEQWLMLQFVRKRYNFTPTDLLNTLEFKALCDQKAENDL